MSANNSLSMDFYKYLCQKIGYEEEVKVRRLFCIIHDLRAKTADNTQITSGSRGEGLQLKGSDLDLMFIDTTFQVYESDRDVPHSGWCMPLVMNTEDTHPCFTQLHLVNDHDFICGHDKTEKDALKNTLHWRKLILNAFQCRKFSSELYRLHTMAISLGNSNVSSMLKFHGPCISTPEETHDFASCLKCDKWISEAQPWITRPRTTWPSPDLISKIISCGVLFVPIGYKGSSNEHLQWRISFSVAEKLFILAFNHCQLLCYALLKILIKEIVEKHEDLKTLLCSYFLKTLMFWISEELDPSMWRAENIIPCFMACLKRLIYCVEYSTLLHYFIPDNNLFYLRFDVDKKDKMTSILKTLFENGVCCFASSKTLFDIIGLPYAATDLSKSRRIEFLNITEYTHNHHPFNLLYFFLHYSRTKISKSIFLLMMSSAHQNIPQISHVQPKSNNKHKYYKYKRDLSHLLIGTNSDAVAGWLLLASFFNVHEHYLLSLDIINHALRKDTSEKIYPCQSCLNQNKKYFLYLLKETELCTILKVITVKCPKFHLNSPISPQELQLNAFEQVVELHPMIFAHFLSFLCYYHLHEQRSCKTSLLQLRQIITANRSHTYNDTLSIICLGICYQMIGDTHSARQCFLQATQTDEYNLTSAAIRLSNCNVD